MDATSLWWMALLVFAIALVIFDVLFKRLVYKKLPHDSMSDMALAALAFAGVYFLSSFLDASGGRVQQDVAGWRVAAPFLLIILQVLMWMLFMLAGTALHGRSERWLLLSYAVGVFWFTLTAGSILLIVPQVMGLRSMLVLVGFSLLAGATAAGAAWILERFFRAIDSIHPRNPEYDWRPFLHFVNQLDQTMQFVGLKWLREKKLSTAPERVEALQVALDIHLLKTYEVENPKNPEHPVTACRVNWDHPFAQNLLSK